MTCEHLAHLVTQQGVIRVSHAAENVFAAANRPCLGTALSLVPRCVEPDCPNPASRNVHVCVECVYSACDSESALDMTPAESSAASISDDDVAMMALDQQGTANASRAPAEDAAAVATAEKKLMATTTATAAPKNTEDRVGGEEQPDIALPLEKDLDPVAAGIQLQGGGNRKRTRYRSHLTKHDSDASHPISLSVDHGRLFCSRCNDFVYNPVLDAAVESQRRIAVSHRRNFLSTQSPLDPQPYPLSEHALVRARSKRRRLVSIEHWTPTEREMQIIDANSIRRDAQAISPISGPVGLYNLGNSCYMNSVLQAFLNAPPLRYFFLADGHRPYCTRKPKSDCLACAIDKLVCDSYVGEISGAERGSTESTRDGSTVPSHCPFLVPQRVLEIMWKHAEHLASYMQHDAHEFLIATLNVLNAHCRRASHKKSGATVPSVKLISPRNHDGGQSPSTRDGVKASSMDKAISAESSVTQGIARNRSRSSSAHNGGPPSPVGNLRGIAACGLGKVKPALIAAERSIVQNLFSGTMQSDVICGVCGNSSPTLEKFFDISLDVDNVIKPSVALRRSRGQSPEISRGLGGTDFGGVGGSVHGPNSTPGSGSSRAGSVEGPLMSSVVQLLHGKAGGKDGGGGKADSHSQRSDGTREEAGMPGLVDMPDASPSPSVNEGVADSGELGEMETANSLAECLSRFTEPEMLGQSAKMFCSVCGTRQEAMKQMSIRALPPVLCLHFKRFEQSFLKVRRSEMVKVDTVVEFPVDGLNMESFRTSSVLRRRTERGAGVSEPWSLAGGERPPADDGRVGGLAVGGGSGCGAGRSAYGAGCEGWMPAPGCPSPLSAPPAAAAAAGEGGVCGGFGLSSSSSSCDADAGGGDGGAIYDLFAVVNHTGKIDRGHYTTLVRRRGAWFRCEDDKVSREPDMGPVIRSGEAYLVFYVQRQPNFLY